MSNPEKIGRYEVRGVIGRGGMGVVYLAWDPVIDREVALKCLDLKDFTEAQAKEIRERFRREAIAAGRLNHPFIITIFDVGEHEGEAFIAMEYVKGHSLDSVLTKEALLPLDRVAEIIDGIAQALDHAHDEKIVHRDIKPGNILLPESGGVRVTDFGIARIDNLRMTREGAMLGSPSYMSPEQVLGKEVDRRSDVFSLGVILYIMLTGEKPFPGDSLATVSYRIVQEPPTPPSQLAPSLDTRIDEIISNALSKDPSKRYQRAGDMAAALKTVVFGVDFTQSSLTITGTQLKRDPTIPAVTLIPADEEVGIIKKYRNWIPLVAAILLIPVILVIAWRLAGRNPALPPESATVATAAAAGNQGPYEPVGVTPRTYILWRDAQVAREKGDMKQVARLLTELTMLSPQDAQAYLEMGKAQQKLGDEKSALESYRRAIQIDPKMRGDPEFVSSLVALLGTGYAQEAASLLGQGPGDTVEKTLLTVASSNNAALKREALNILVQLWRKKLEKNPGDVDTMLNIAGALYKLGNFPEAIGEYAAAIKLRPQAGNDPLIIFNAIELLDSRYSGDATRLLVDSIGPPALDSLRKVEQDKSARSQKRAREVLKAILEKQRHSEPKNANVPLELASLYADDGDLAASMSALSDAMNRNISLANDPKVAALLMKALGQADTDAVRKIIVEKVGKSAVPVLQNALTDIARNVRWNAKTALEEMKESNKINYPEFWGRELSDKKTNCSQKKEAVNALVTLNTPEAQNVFNKYANDPDVRRCGISEFKNYSSQPEQPPRTGRKPKSQPEPAPAPAEKKKKGSKIFKIFHK